MMDCLNFRRRLLEDPNQHAWGMARHESECASCAAYAEKVRHNEQQLHDLLNAPVPAEMAERIQLAVSLDDKAPAPRHPQPMWLATAASIMVAAIAGVLWLGTPQIEHHQQASLSQAVLHHIDDETHVLRQPGPVGPYQVNQVFERFGANVEGTLGPISFAAECKMRHKTGVHLVIPGEMGAITVLFMPGEMMEDTQSISTQRFAGQIHPMQWGSIAIVGEKGENLDPVVQRVTKMVKWPSVESLAMRQETPRVQDAAKPLRV